MILFTVETGFQANEITVREGNLGKMCLTTVGALFYDTVINVTLMEGSAGRDGICVEYTSKNSTSLITVIIRESIDSV